YDSARSTPRERVIAAGAANPERYRASTPPLQACPPAVRLSARHLAPRGQAVKQRLRQGCYGGTNAIDSGTASPNVDGIWMSPPIVPLARSTRRTKALPLERPAVQNEPPPMTGP